jgi:hypothetical protein
MRQAWSWALVRSAGAQANLYHPEKVLTPNDFPGTGTLSHALRAFVHRYNLTARPFNWKFPVDELTALLRRISQREQATTSQQATLPQAA